MNAAPLPVLLVDDEPTVRRALGRCIRGRLHLLECETLDQALAVIERRDQPLCGAIVDVFLNGRDGLDLLPALRLRSPAMPILVLTGHRRPEITHRAFQLGAYAVLKPPPAETIQHFARLVELAHAHCWDVVDAVQRLGARCALSPAQTRLVGLFATCASRAQVARELGITENTLRKRIRVLLRQTGQADVRTLLASLHTPPPPGG